jgi:hypoxanthine-DNA glycosylase
MSDLLHGFEPTADARTRLIVLGSFPSVASLATGERYAHPRNAFWPILSELWGEDLRKMPYSERCECMLARGLGAWDVYASCEREGSLDSAIANAQVNDFARLKTLAPKLQAIAHNGGESARHRKHTEALGLPVYALPSTSPANASWSFQRKLEAWREVFSRHGLA